MLKQLVQRQNESRTGAQRKQDQPANPTELGISKQSKDKHCDAQDGNHYQNANDDIHLVSHNLPRKLQKDSGLQV